MTELEELALNDWTTWEQNKCHNNFGSSLITTQRGDEHFRKKHLNVDELIAKLPDLNETDPLDANRNMLQQFLEAYSMHETKPETFPLWDSLVYEHNGWKIPECVYENCEREQSIEKFRERNAFQYKP